MIEATIVMKIHRSLVEIPIHIIIIIVAITEVAIPVTIITEDDDPQDKH
jgi:hypothetical protein